MAIETNQNNSITEHFFQLEFYCTKGLNVYLLEPEKYAILDSLGYASLPFVARDDVTLFSLLWTLAGIRPLLRGNSALLRYPNHPYDTEIPYRVEELYVARLSDFYRIWLCGSGDWQYFDSLLGRLPTAYLDCGYGAGSKDTLEAIHNETIQLIRKGSSALTEEILFAHLLHIQLGRICDDIVALIHRACVQFKLLLLAQRRAITGNAKNLGLMEINELLHVGPSSRDAALHVTNVCIALCTSLDLSAKLLWFINDNKIPPRVFHPARGKHFEEVRRLRAEAVPEVVIDKIKGIWSSKKTLGELIQFRHDLIHSTTALELERKLYVGFGTDEILKFPLHYSYQPWRDTDPTGQPYRLLGRDYFTSKNTNIEETLYHWLNDVIDGHIEIGDLLLGFFQSARNAPCHRLSGT